MNNYGIIVELDNYRIIEIEDEQWDWDNLKSDCYDTNANTDIDSEELKQRQKDFEMIVLSEGVYGYELQKWNPNIGCGWETKDSCWGFVGTYENHGHYIIDEFTTQIYEG